MIGANGRYVSNKPFHVSVGDARNARPMTALHPRQWRCGITTSPHILTLCAADCACNVPLRKVRTVQAHPQ
jgi:hypothetical protein